MVNPITTVISNENELMKIFSDYRKLSPEAKEELNISNKEIIKINTFKQIIRTRNLIKSNHIKDMLNYCIERCYSDKGLEFLESLKDQFKRTNTLSPKQITALENWYEKTY